MLWRCCLLLHWRPCPCINKEKLYFYKVITNIHHNNSSELRVFTSNISMAFNYLQPEMRWSQCPRRCWVHWCPNPHKLLTQQWHVELWKLVSITAVEGGSTQLYVYWLYHLPVRVPGLSVQWQWSGLTIHSVSTLDLILGKGQFPPPFLVTLHAP